MTYTEKQLLEAKKWSFEEGTKHSRASNETKELLRKQMEEFKIILGSHESIEKETTLELLHKIMSVTDLVQKHIDETANSDRMIRDLITGSKVAKGWFFTLVALVAGLGVLAGSAIAVKEWIKR